MTNQVVSGYTDKKIYDEISSYLPKNAVIPPGTTGADFLSKFQLLSLNRFRPANYPLLENLILARGLVSTLKKSGNWHYC